MCAGAGVSSSAAFVCSSALAVLTAYGVSATKAVRPQTLTVKMPSPLRAGAGLSSSSSCVCAGALATASGLCPDRPLTKRVSFVTPDPVPADKRAVQLIIQSSWRSCCGPSGLMLAEAMRGCLEPLLQATQVDFRSAGMPGRAGGRRVCVHMRTLCGHPVRRHGPGHRHDGHAGRRAAHQLRPGAPTRPRQLARRANAKDSGPFYGLHAQSNKDVDK